MERLLVARVVRGAGLCASEVRWAGWASGARDDAAMGSCRRRGGVGAGRGWRVDRHRLHVAFAARRVDQLQFAEGSPGWRRWKTRRDFSRHLLLGQAQALAEHADAGAQRGADCGCPSQYELAVGLASGGGDVADRGLGRVDVRGADQDHDDPGRLPGLSAQRCRSLVDSLLELRELGPRRGVDLFLGVLAGDRRLRRCSDPELGDAGILPGARATEK